ncbi:ZC21C protein, partial [Chloroceryle aenea]|nr:ZC21C protein [Chloroceryle aenea]
VHNSRLEWRRNNFQHELLPNRGESLAELCARKRWSDSYSQPADSSQYSSRHGSSRSAGLQGKYLASQTKTPPVKSGAGRKEGVDRAHPLKPVFPHVGVDVPVVNTAQLACAPYMEEAPNSWPRSMSKREPQSRRSPLAPGLCPWTAEPEQSASYLYRRGQTYILKLEADGRHLEEEIRKKEDLLREKLRRTEELLWRIQKEKELAQAEERHDRKVKRAREQKASRHPEEKTGRVRPGDGVFGGAQPAEATIPQPGTTLHHQALAMGKFKEHPVASNSKIQDCSPMEHVAFCSKPSPRCSPSPSALSDQDSGDQLSAEVLCMQTARAVEQEGREQCSFCGRKFLCTRLEKHMSICGKSQGSQRKAFDSRKARIRGTDLEQYQQWRSSENPQNEPPRKNNWRQKHEILIRTLQQARQVQQGLSRGGKVSDLPPLPPINNTDYVPCPYCKRRFAPRVAERHIPKCKNIRNRPPPPLLLKR